MSNTDVRVAIASQACAATGWGRLAARPSTERREAHASAICTGSRAFKRRSRRPAWPSSRSTYRHWCGHEDWQQRQGRRRHRRRAREAAATTMHLCCSTKVRQNGRSEDEDKGRAGNLHCGLERRGAGSSKWRAPCMNHDIVIAARHDRTDGCPKADWGLAGGILHAAPSLAAFVRRILQRARSLSCSHLKRTRALLSTSAGPARSVGRARTDNSGREWVGFS
jgi:hypothetical protein